MAFPWLAAIATTAGALGTLFGEGPEASPELQNVFQMLQNRQSTGMTPQEMALRRQQLNTGLSNEAGGLSAVTSQRLARQGASAGATNAALSNIMGQRLRALGSGIAEIQVADEEQKRMDERQRIALLAQLAGQFPGTEGTGGGFAQLFGSGLQGLLNWEGGNSGGGGGGSFSNFALPSARPRQPSPFGAPGFGGNR